MAIQDVRGVDKAQNGRGYNDDGTAYTVDAMATQGVAMMRESGQGYWMEDDKAGTLRAEGEDRPSRPSHVIAQAFQQSQSDVRVDDITGTLRSSTAGGLHDHGVVQCSSVRRLLPVECERLQGLPDNWTLIPWRGKPASECPDGPRYKDIGNGQTVNVMEWLAKRIKSALDNSRLTTTHR